MIRESEPYKTELHKQFDISRRMALATSAIFLVLLVWQTFSASIQHQHYQESLMDSVTNNLLSEFQHYFSQLRHDIDGFQQQNKPEIDRLQKLALKSSESDYMLLLNKLKSSIEHTRLFAIIDPQGNGSLKHITGDFLPSCEDEISSTFRHGAQEKLFLHHSKTSVHFDLLQPLLTKDGQGSYFFVAFNSDVLQKLLIKFQLPHQQLFLMRTDQIGKIELTSEQDDEKYNEMTMTEAEIASFTYQKPIPGTRWSLAIRLDPEYSTRIYTTGFIKAMSIWVLLTALFYGFYRLQKVRMTKQRKMSQELSYQSDYDQLTGLANRAKFYQLLLDLITVKRAEKHNNFGVVLHIDIDQFQVINNSYGYAVGDKCLFIISLALQKYLPLDATISRLANDEFAVLLPSIAHIEAKNFSNKLRQYFQRIDLSSLFHNINLTASIGVVVLDRKQLEQERVLSSLSKALSLAKEKGKNRVQLYQSDDKSLQQHANEMASVHELSEALKENRLLLYRQKIKGLNITEPPMHYEVLVRMKSKNGDIIAPFAFVPAAEKYGQIKQLDLWVIEATFKAISTYNDDCHYSINLSGVTLADQDISPLVKSLITQYQINPKQIAFEITETSAIRHLKSALHFIQQMTELGCQFSLDDFGQGLSSFSYLQQLPVSKIKIDGAFVRDMHENKINRSFVENIQRTAMVLEKQTVAEFVESEEVEQLLCELGITFAQGYHIHKPEHWFEHPFENM